MYQSTLHVLLNVPWYVICIPKTVLMNICILLSKYDALSGIDVVFHVNGVLSHGMYGAWIEYV